MMDNGTVLQVIIVEPSPAVRYGLKALLEQHRHFQVKAMYGSWTEYTERYTPDHSGDILVINPVIWPLFTKSAGKVYLSDVSYGLLVALHYQYVPAPMLSEFDGVVDIFDDAPTLCRKLRHLWAEHQQQPHRHNTDDSATAGLSEREKEILIAVAKGLANKEIADRHNISIHTVMSHRKNITRKTGIKTVSGLTMFALFNNLIAQDDLE